MKKYFLAVSVLLAGCGGGGSGGGSAEITPTVQESVSEAVPVVTAPKLDVAGSWKVLSQNCQGLTFGDTMVTVNSTVSGIQHFVATDQFGSSDGLFDVESGDFFFCYLGTVSQCTLGCVGTVYANYKTELICDDNTVPASLCDLTAQKI